MKKIASILAFGIAIVLASCNAATQSSKSAVSSGSPDLSALNPGQYDNTWWNRAPYRLVQTNLREINTTMNVNAYYL